MYMALDTADLRVYTSPVSHYVPTLGVRVELPASRRSLVFSSDTRPCPSLTRLAQDTDFLIHEATGAHTGHSSAFQAGETARQANAKALYLIHYPVWESDPRRLVDEARASYGNSVYLAEDLQVIEISR
jgi:ribonuclease BN (tRNA processing enzyme)